MKSFLFASLYVIIFGSIYLLLVLALAGAFKKVFKYSIIGPPPTGYENGGLLLFLTALIGYFPGVYSLIDFSSKYISFLSELKNGLLISIDQVVKESNQNPFTTILTVGSLLLALYFYRKSKKVKRIKFSDWKWTTLISKPEKDDTGIKNGLLEEITILHKGVEIGALTLISFSIKNVGNAVIRREDLFEYPTLSFSKEAKVLKADAKANKNHINPRILSVDKKVILEFDFLEPKDLIDISVAFSSNSYEESIETTGILSEKIIGGDHNQYKFDQRFFVIC